MSNSVGYGTANPLVQRKKVYYEGSDTVYEGMALCYNQDTTTNWLGWDKENSTAGTTTAEGYQNEGKLVRVEKPATANLKFFAGLVAPGDWCGKSGPAMIEVYVPAGGVVPGRATESVTIGEAAYIVNADYELTNVPTEGGFVGYFMETIDRSSTEGLAYVQLVPPIVGRDISVENPEAKTAAFTLSYADHGKIFTNKGDADALTVTLPTASTVTGLKATFVVQAVQNIALSPQAGDRIVFGNDSDACADGEDLTLTPADANDEGMNITIVSDGDNWQVVSAWAPAVAKFVIP